MFGKQKRAEKAIKQVVVDMVRDCPNRISLNDLNGQKPEPMATKILLTVKG